jgi:hypothetical protein
MGQRREWLNQAVPVVLLVPMAVVAALSVVVLSGRWRLERLARRNRVRIAGLGDDTGRNPDSGAVHSIQTATVTTPTERLDALWSPPHLERFARAYWQYMERFSLNMIRVFYDDDGRYVCLLHRRLCLLGFGPPEYEFDGGRGLVRWPIREGLLVARGRDQGFLELEVRRHDGVASVADDEAMTRVEVELEVAHFYPTMSSGLAYWIYKHTQSRYHVLLAYGFIRSLGRGELPESAVGRFANWIAEDMAVPAEDAAPADVPASATNDEPER